MTMIADDLPAGFTLDKPESADSLPEGFKLDPPHGGDDLPTGFKLDAPAPTASAPQDRWTPQPGETPQAMLHRLNVEGNQAGEREWQQHLQESPQNHGVLATAGASLLAGINRTGPEIVKGIASLPVISSIPGAAAVSQKAQDEMAGVDAFQAEYANRGHVADVMHGVGNVAGPVILSAVSPGGGIGMSGIQGYGRKMGEIDQRREMGEQIGEGHAQMLAGLQGSIDAAMMKFAPGAGKIVGNQAEKLAARLGAPAAIKLITNWLGKVVGGGAEGGVMSGVANEINNLAEGRPIGTNLGPSVEGGAIFGGTVAGAHGLVEMAGQGKPSAEKSIEVPAVVEHPIEAFATDLPPGFTLDKPQPTVIPEKPSPVQPLRLPDNLSEAGKATIEATKGGVETKLETYAKSVGIETRGRTIEQIADDVLAHKAAPQTPTAAGPVDQNVLRDFDVPPTPPMSPENVRRPSHGGYSGEAPAFPVRTESPESRAATPDKTYDDLRGMNAQELRVEAKNRGVVFDAPSTTIPRILDWQERNALNNLTDKQLWDAVRQRGHRAGSREANISTLMREQPTAAPAPQNVEAPNAVPTVPVEEKPQAAREVRQRQEAPVQGQGQEVTASGEVARVGAGDAVAPSPAPVAAEPTAPTQAAGGVQGESNAPRSGTPDAGWTVEGKPLDAAQVRAGTGEVPPVVAEKGKAVADAQSGMVGYVKGLHEDTVGTLNVAPIEKFVKDDVGVTAQKVAAAAGDLKRSIQRTFAPQTQSKQSQAVGDMLREAGANTDLEVKRLEQSTMTARKHFDKMKPEESHDFINRMQAGKGQTSPALNSIAKQFREALDGMRKEVQSLGEGKLKQFDENYFPQAWKLSKTNEAISDFLAKRPLEGKKGFLKPRTFDKFQDGLDAGYEPISNNPVDLVLHKAVEMRKFIESHKYLAEMKRDGIAKFVKVGDDLPDGYVRADIPAFKVYGSNEVTIPMDKRATVEPDTLNVFGRRQIGDWAVPREVADVFNNHLSPGLRGNQAFRAYLGLGNVMLQARLGWSAFHLGFTTIDAMTSRTALSIEQAVRGEFGAAAKTALSFPISPITNAMTGARLRAEMLRPGTHPEMAQVARMAQLAGGRIGMDSVYQTRMYENMKTAFKDGNYIGGIVRLPLGLTDLAARPLMQYIVPRQKLGIFADLARHEMGKLGPNASITDQRRAMAKAWDSVDNRMGQLVYDNNFWNKTAKDISMASVQSLGWNLGTFRELLGGAKDWGSFAKNLTTGKRAEFSHRMAYTLALPLTAGVLGAVTQYLFTGKGPSEIRDYFYPKTGRKDLDGEDVRMQLPTYMKDVIGATNHPARMVVGKIHPMIGTIADMLMNRDFYNTKIRNEDDPLMKQVLDETKFIGKAFAPYAATNIAKLSKDDAPISEKAATLVGVTPAPKEANQTNAEREAFDISRNKLPVGSRTQEESDKSIAENDLYKKIKAMEPKAREAELDRMVKAGTLDKDAAKKIKDRSGMTPLQWKVKHFDAGEAIKVYGYANDEERADLRDIVRDHILNGRMTPDEQDAKLKEIGIPAPIDISINRRAHELNVRKDKADGPLTGPETAELTRLGGYKKVIKQVRDSKATDADKEKKIAAYVKNYGKVKQ